MNVIDEQRDLIVRERVVLLKYRARVATTSLKNSRTASMIVNAVNRILDVLDEMLLALEDEIETEEGK